MNNKDVIINKLLSFISSSSTENISTAIYRNTDLSQLLTEQYRGYLFIAKMFKDEYKDDLSKLEVKDVLSILSKERPDLYKVITEYPNNKGILWLNFNIKNLKRVLL